MNKKLFVSIATIAIYTTPLLVVTPSFAKTMYPTRGEEKREIRETLKEKAKNISLNAKLTGDITLISTNALTVSKDSKTYTVNISASTKLFRRYGAKATLSEFAVGDKVNVIGKWTDDGKTAINATYVRDISVQKKNANFRGKVVSKGTNSFVINPTTQGGKRAGNKTINVATNVVYKSRTNKTITFADIKVGDMVNVIGGIWNTQESVVNGVTKVIDTTQPIK